MDKNKKLLTLKEIEGIKKKELLTEDEKNEIIKEGKEKKALEKIEEEKEFIESYNFIVSQNKVIFVDKITNKQIKAG
jgi:hypothetical protein